MQFQSIAFDSRITDEEFARQMQASPYDDDAYQTELRSKPKDLLAGGGPLSVEPALAHSFHAGFCSLLPGAMLDGKGQPGNPVRVVDLGGADGDHFVRIKRLIPADIAIDWKVVELPGRAEAAQQHFTTEGLSFHSDLDAVMADGCDIFVSSGALTYMPDPFDMLARIGRHAPPAILFDRLHVTGGHQPVRALQTTVYDVATIQYPITFLALDSFIQQVGMFFDLKAHWLGQFERGVIQPDGQWTCFGFTATSR